jgi:hypothetical protein
VTSDEQVHHSDQVEPSHSARVVAARVTTRYGLDLYALQRSLRGSEERSPGSSLSCSHTISTTASPGKFRL